MIGLLGFLLFDLRCFALDGIKAKKRNRRKSEANTLHTLPYSTLGTCGEEGCRIVHPESNLRQTSTALAPLALVALCILGTLRYTVRYIGPLSAFLSSPLFHQLPYPTSSERG